MSEVFEYHDENKLVGNSNTHYQLIPYINKNCKQCNQDTGYVCWFCECDQLMDYGKCIDNGTVIFITKKKDIDKKYWETDEYSAWLKDKFEKIEGAK